MNNKKDIDSIYRERFRNAKVKPPEDAWDNILFRLPPNEKKKMVLPWWYLAAGTAAAVLITFGLFIKPPKDISTPQVVSGKDPIENMYERVNVVSESFQEQMTTAGKMLENLRKTNTPAQAHKELTGVSEKTFQAHLDFPEALEVLKDSYSSKDFSDAVTSAEEEVASPEEKAVAEETDPVQNKIEEGLVVAEVENQKLEKRFSVTTRVAPVFFDNFGKGNPLDSKFAQNNAAGEVSVSYGMNMAYQISDKVKVRSGVSKVDLAYHTTEVSFNDYASAAGTKAKETMGTMIASPVKGELTQSLGFIEVPLEVEYALLEKKIGINLIGGASALFLNRNEISLDSGNFSDELGSAKNLNNLSFSTNIGMGFNYGFSENFGINIEPILKLQLNTFKDVEGLNPFYFGIYSGLSYKF